MGQNVRRATPLRVSFTRPLHQQLVVNNIITRDSEEANGHKDKNKTQVVIERSNDSEVRLPAYLRCSELLET